MKQNSVNFGKFIETHKEVTTGISLEEMEGKIIYKKCRSNYCSEENFGKRLRGDSNDKDSNTNY